MNKYKEALIYFCNGCDHEYEEGDYGQCKKVEGRCKHYKVFQELVDKETLKSVEYISTVGDSDGYPVYDVAICPSCSRKFEVEYEEHYNYCPHCGQHLNWGNEN